MTVNCLSVTFWFNIFENHQDLLEDLNKELDGEYANFNFFPNNNNVFNPVILGKNDDNLVDLTLKFGKKHEDLFYKIITLLNKKQIKLPQIKDEKNRLIPIPLISWNGALTEKEIIDISYEINDRYSFDFTKNYHTTEFYLNKMLYILENDLMSDVDELLKRGSF